MILRVLKWGILPKLHVQVKTIQKIENKEQKVKVLQQKNKSITQESSNHQFFLMTSLLKQLLRPKMSVFFTFFAVNIWDGFSFLGPVGSTMSKVHR